MNAATGPLRDFRLGDWTVQPALNRLQRGDASVRLEPKLMDVLVFLAGHPLEVLSKDRIADAVWPSLYITDAVITRAIASLRQALGDDAQRPSFIETISKRGYRLVAHVEGATTALAAPSAGTAVPAAPSLPFTVGQWVRGERFYGRRDLLAELLDGPRGAVWLLGARRVGKTSVLRQLELLAAAPERADFPLFWDLQGAEGSGDLQRELVDALLDAEERLAELGLRVEEVEGEDLFATLDRLRRALRLRGRRLLLLCDEVEQLLALHRREPGLLAKLRRALQSREEIRSVLAASVRLWQLADAPEDTSPFLHGFVPRLPLGPLSDEDARALIVQEQLPTAARPRFAEGDVESIRSACGNHPYLLQLVAKRALEAGDAAEAVRQVAADPMVAHYFAVDFGLLGAGERTVLQALAGGAASLGTLLDETGLQAPELEGTLLALAGLGYLTRRDQDVALRSTFFARWLAGGAAG